MKTLLENDPVFLFLVICIGLTLCVIGFCFIALFIEEYIKNKKANKEWHKFMRQKPPKIKTHAK